MTPNSSIWPPISWIHLINGNNVDSYGKQVDSANDVEEEQNLAKEWTLYVRLKNGSSDHSTAKQYSSTKMDIDQGNKNVEGDYELVEIKTLQDSDKYVRPESILIMRRRPHSEIQEIRKTYEPSMIAKLQS